ncbi:cation:proton antiporter [Paracoccus sp. 11-3]|uniref:Cation:proton antiporter n=1 Tax=Paracoccus amoyensis TaxID=2760093 RepID=A0A926GHF7_9RHOB|nr:monovalent cation/H(+) antiporter subunit G [Paracoccus amoyensis]MBC9247384.1 cation:proton antiporter [Paracoccus amoyensis]
MNGFEGLPLWISIPVALLVMLGATLTLIGALGFVQLSSFYDRLHAPTLGASWGTGAIILASSILATYLQQRLVVHELVIGLCVLVTIPVTLMLLGRTALLRDRTENPTALPEKMRNSLDAEDAAQQEQEAEERAKQSSA